LLPQFAKGQYIWSMMMGLLTLVIRMFWKVTFETTVLTGEFSHVFMRTPFVVPVMLLSLTKSPLTSFSYAYLPRLPMLRPWPGPQLILAMTRSEFPCPIEMQSSPVRIWVSTILTSVLASMWIPSVLGLVSGASSMRLLARNFLQPITAMWKNFGLSDVIFFTIVSFVPINFTDCNEDQVELANLFW
jgi:hypothetical protein